MSDDYLFSHADDHGDELNIEPHSGGAAFAFVYSTGADGDTVGIFVPAHKVPAFCRAMHEAAGLPVPDLPDIPDPELVEALANDLECAVKGILTTAMPDMKYVGYARTLLLSGWRKDLDG